MRGVKRIRNEGEWERGGVGSGVGSEREERNEKEWGGEWNEWSGKGTRCRCRYDDDIVVVVVHDDDDDDDDDDDNDNDDDDDAVVDNDVVEEGGRGV